ncbi:ABC transporter substrate-binding protein [Kallotenue papyrolyticum]|uniref:ABC transporter substrate-binding protein n=1 Tax=Kallotenue papyrolyticum TaxID=1325125 RepID=UPI00047014AC|nr:sugar ABC transporter substrate-binding protein [Kallotenue papyrolyticum]
MQTWRRVVVWLSALLLAACAGGAPSAPGAASSPATTAGGSPSPAAAAQGASGVKELTIIWAEWDPANYLQQLVKDYTAETGVEVKVVQEPWGSFGDRVFTEFAGKGSSYDLVVGDSQWLGQGATQGHYVELTDIFMSELNGGALEPATITYYAEYPTGSGRYWAYPTEGDADGWSYRKDLFEDPKEKEAFKAKYGYDLDVPKTWEQLRDIAEFFTRPDQNLYGVSIYTQKDYDAITMGYENTLFSWGADWGDRQTYKVDGVLNSPEGVAALEFYKELYKFTPPGSSNVFWQESIDHFTSGQVAMAMNYFAFFPGLANPATNPYADRTGFFSNPAGPTGKRHAALGGQGMSIVSYISPERQQAAKEFLKWFAKDETQQKWAELGGYTCNANILKSEAFLENTPFNRAFAESMQMVKDFWAVPMYGELLEVSQRELHNYVVADQGTAKEALDRIAQEHERIFRNAGLLK